MGHLSAKLTTSLDKSYQPGQAASLASALIPVQLSRNSDLRKQLAQLISVIALIFKKKKCFGMSWKRLTEKDRLSKIRVVSKLYATKKTNKVVQKLTLGGKGRRQNLQ